jgi:hypothetical protein
MTGAIKIFTDGRPNEHLSNGIIAAMGTSRPNWLCCRSFLESADDGDFTFVGTGNGRAGRAAERTVMWPMQMTIFLDLSILLA